MCKLEGTDNDELGFNIKLEVKIWIQQYKIWKYVKNICHSSAINLYVYVGYYSMANKHAKWSSCQNWKPFSIHQYV